MPGWANRPGSGFPRRRAAAPSRRSGDEEGDRRAGRDDGDGAGDGHPSIDPPLPASPLSARATQSRTCAAKSSGRSIDGTWATSGHTTARTSRRPVRRWSAARRMASMSSSPEITSVGTAISSSRSGGSGVSSSSASQTSSGQSTVSSNARRCMVRTASRTAAGTRSGPRCGPSTQATTFASAAPSRSPASTALPSSSQNAASSSVRSVISEPPGAASTREATAPGRSNASSTATPAPKEQPTTWARSTPRASRVARTSARGDHGPAGRSVDSPNPRRSTRTTSRSAVSVGQMESHIRRSAMPAWRSRIGVEPVGPERS